MSLLWGEQHGLMLAQLLGIQEEAGKGAYGNSKHSTEPIQQVIVTQKFRGDDIF